jgi:mannose-6-phosphate isomerase-like protein (cupin superfamily)
MTDTSMIPVVLDPGEGTRYSAGPSTVTIKLGSRETGGMLALLEYAAAPGFEGPERHVHPEFDECFYVLEGQGRFTVGEQTLDVGTGGTVFAPGECPHTFANPFAQPLRMLLVCRPGGFDQFVADVGEAAADGRIADPTFMPALWERYGMAVAG